VPDGLVETDQCIQRMTRPRASSDCWIRCQSIALDNDRIDGIRDQGEILRFMMEQHRWHSRCPNKPGRDCMDARNLGRCEQSKTRAAHGCHPNRTRNESRIHPSDRLHQEMHHNVVLPNAPRAPESIASRSVQ